MPSSILPNGGGIRASIGAGDVTVGDIYNVLPFDNTLVVVELMGMDIIDALEHSVRLWPEQSGGFLQVSGISFEFVPDALPGGRVINVKVGDNAISAGRYYLVATNDFLAAGGDGYDTLKNNIQPPNLTLGHHRKTHSIKQKTDIPKEYRLLAFSK